IAVGPGHVEERKEAPKLRIVEERRAVGHGPGGSRWRPRRRSTSATAVGRWNDEARHLEEGRASKRPRTDQAMMGAMTSATMLISLMRMLSAGPEVSLKGSPTVSPMTAAAWASPPFFSPSISPF